MSDPELMNSVKHSIHPFEFLQSARFSECWFPADETDEVRNDLKDMHPSVFIGDTISFMLFRVNYSYKTNRDNKKEAYKLVFLKEFEGLEEFEASVMIETKFDSWVSDYNFKNPHRKISNVKILDILPYTTASLVIG